MSNWPRGVLYVGVTSVLERRVEQHKTGERPGFTSKYHLVNLAFAEPAPDATAAIQREKQIKSWTRARKIALIEEQNPNWRDLAADWLADEGPPVVGHR